MTEGEGESAARGQRDGGRGPEDWHDWSNAPANASDGQAERAPGEAESEPAQGVLVADNIVAGYVPGVPILNGCTLVLGEGELIGVVGPNGAGKSTLVKTIFGLVDVTSGRLEFQGEDITSLQAHELVSKGIGYVPQINNVFPSLTVEENLEMGLYLAPKRLKERLSVVFELFPRLSERRAQRAGSLSGGERQMVAMSRALMMDPKVLLLDEPSAGLSPILQDQVFVRTKRINQTGVSIIMVEQNARRCLQICDRGYVLDQGRNAYTNTGEALLEDPKVIELYLGTLGKVR
jgi:branched-chain amino acid transport system ATP-binding protein